jgi:predicted TIM-barrel fold metal-dependent hydrolase
MPNGAEGMLYVSPEGYARHMRVIDFHVHAFADPLAARAIEALEEEGGVDARYDGTVTGLRQAMERAGVGSAVVQPVATKPSQVRRINEWAAGLSEPIIGFGSVHPAAEDPAADVAHAAGLGLRGLKLHPEYQEFAPDDTGLDPLYEAAQDAGLVLLFHAGKDIGIPTVRGTPEAFARLIERRSGLRLVLAHMGGFGMWDEVERLLVGKDVYFDTSYTLGHLPADRFVSLVRAHGPERVLFGSDGPWTDMGEELARLRASGLSARELSAIESENALRLLG